MFWHFGHLTIYVLLLKINKRTKKCKYSSNAISLFSALNGLFWMSNVYNYVLDLGSKNLFLRLGVLRAFVLCVCVRTILSWCHWIWLILYLALQLGISFKNFILLKHMSFTDDPPDRFSQFFYFFYFINKIEFFHSIHIKGR